MSEWTPTVGEHAYAITRENGQYIRYKQVTITAVLKTRIKTDDGNFSRYRDYNNSFEEYPAPHSWSRIWTHLYESGSDEVAAAVEAIRVARNVNVVRDIGRKLSALPLDGEDVESVVADAIERLRLVQSDWQESQS